MLNYHEPLTQAESDFAAEHHDLIYDYLNQAGLPKDDFYDIAVFGYLRAVRKYLAEPKTSRKNFTAIACREMDCDICCSREYRMRQKHRMAAETYENLSPLQEAIRKPTVLQRRIASLRCEGYRDQEIAAICRLTPSELDLEMNCIQANIIPYTAETAVAAA